MPPAEAPTAVVKPWYVQPLVWLGFAISGLAVAMFLWLFDATLVYRSLTRLELWVLPPAALAIVCAFLLRAARWQLLLRPVGQVPFGQVRDVLMTGFMVNNVLPARAGELARALVLWKVAGTSRRATLATVATERLFDVALLIGMLSLLGLLFEVPTWTQRLGALTVVLLGGLCALVIWLAAHHRSLFWVTARLLFFLPAPRRQKVLAFLERFVDGTRALRSPGLCVRVLGLSATVWALEVVAYALVMRGLHIDLPLWAAALTVVVANFGIAAPSAPGYVGVFDAACSGSLIALGVGNEAALSCAIAIHLLLYVTVTGSGLLAMWHLELSLSEVVKHDHRDRREHEGEADRG